MFRKLSDTQFKKIIKSIQIDFGVNISSLLKKHVLLIKSKQEVFLINKKVYATVKNILHSKFKKKVKYLGIKFGTFTNTSFMLDIEVACSLLKQNYTFLNKVKINDIGEKLFLYGHNLFKKSILSFSPRIKKGSLVFVLNSFDECLGIGRALSNFKFFNRFHENKVVIKNIVDRGIYLRTEF